VQLRGETPSHIVLPAIHIKKEEVGELFHQKIGTEKGATDPPYLARAARQKLREVFLAADAGITGVNFAVAETGGFVVCTNEGYADLGASLP
jgi:L-lactate dehydrogenase complex protein LldF